MEKIYCMIVGDIISSKSISTDERLILQEKLKNILDKINYDYQYSIISPFTITLGDEFQGGLYDSSKIFEILEIIKLEISPIRIRVGIGIQKIRTNIQIRNSFGTDGDSYYGARKEIELLKKRKTFEYGYSFSTGSDNDILLNSLFLFIDELSSKWTEKQIEYIRKLNVNESIDSLARRMNVNSSTISRTLKRANYSMVVDTIKKVSDYLYSNYSTGNNQNVFIKKYNSFINDISNMDLDIDESIINESNLDTFEKIMLLSSISYYYSKHDISEKAIDFAHKAMSYMDNGDYNAIRIRLLNIIATSYLKLKIYEKAVKKLKEALYIIQYESDIKYRKFVTLGNLAHCYLDYGKYDLSIDCINQSRNILQNDFPNDFIDKIKMNSLEAKLLYMKKDFEGCQILLRKNLAIARDYLDKNEYSIAVILQWLAKSLIKANENELNNEIIELIEESNRILKKNKSFSGIIENYDILIEYYEKSNNQFLKENIIQNKLNFIEEMKK